MAEASRWRISDNEMVDEVDGLADVLNEAENGQYTNSGLWEWLMGVAYRVESSVDCISFSSSSYKGVVRREVCHSEEAKRREWLARCVNASGHANDSWAK